MSKKKEKQVRSKESQSKLREILKRFNPDTVQVEVLLHREQGEDFLDCKRKNAIAWWNVFGKHFSDLSDSVAEIAGILLKHYEDDSENWEGDADAIIGFVKPETAFELFKTGVVTLRGCYWDDKALSDMF